MKKIKYIFEALIIYFFLFIIKLLGLDLSRKLFSFIFKNIGFLVKSKKVVNSNLEKILGNIGNLERNNIHEKMWSNYGKTFVEYMFLNKFKNENIHIKIKGEELITKIKNKNKPVVFVSGHFANYELMSMELVKRGINLATIYRPLNNFLVNPFMEYVRRKNVCKHQIKKGFAGIRDAVNYVNKNFSIALMIDQRVSEGERLEFFNKKALTTTLPAQLALKYKCDIFPVYISREKSSNFVMEIYEPISINNLENNEINKINISNLLNKSLEKMILRDPSQWILTHNRWK
tara:strand:+ start:246 stop:1112 length:867 start_codon:yes stop_codon:yes gene_type:complete